jgi:hypothetical protein
MAKRKRTNNDLQNITHKSKTRATRTPLKTGGELWCPGRISSSCSTSGTRCVTLVTNPVIKSWIMKEPESVYDKWNISVVICDRCSVTVNQAIIVYICCQTLMLDYNYRLVMIKGNITSYFSYYMTAVNRTTTYNDDSGYLLLVYVNILQPSYMILSTFKPV